MMTAIAFGCLGTGTVFASRHLCIASRGIGATLIALEWLKHCELERLHTEDYK